MKSSRYWLKAHKAHHRMHHTSHKLGTWRCSRSGCSGGGLCSSWVLAEGKIISGSKAEGGADAVILSILFNLMNSADKHLFFCVDAGVVAVAKFFSSNVVQLVDDLTNLLRLTAI